MFSFCSITKGDSGGTQRHLCNHRGARSREYDRLVRDPRRSGQAGTFTIRDYSSFTAQVTADTGKVNYIRSTSDATKVWVRTTILSNGSAGVGFIAAQAGAVNRTLQDKDRDTVHVKDFGGIIDGVTDTTAASNLATGAADTYGPSLRRAIHLSDGTTVLGASNVPLFVRKGQTLTAQGWDHRGSMSPAAPPTPSDHQARREIRRHRRFRR
jgi:hypothetical protein